MPEAMTYPKIGVMDTIEWTGAKSLSQIEDGGLYAQNIMSVKDAMETLFETDAHFTCYRPVGMKDEEWPRFNKTILPQLRHLDCDIEMTCFAVDIDNPDHQRWNAPLLKEFWVQLEQAYSEDFPYPLEYTWMYFTKHGVRLVWVLKDPIPVDVAEEHHRWLCQELIRRGLTGVDLSCSDWTRVFRCPLVMRGGEPSWEEEYYDLYEQLEFKMDARDLGKAERVKSSHYAQIILYEEPQPAPEDHDQWLKEPNDKGKLIWSKFRNLAKRRLKNRDCYPCLFDNEPLAEAGKRNNTIAEYVGQAMGLVSSIEGCTPQAIYFLFFSAVEQLVPDSDTDDWLEVLWGIVSRTWEKEDAKIRYQEAEQVAMAETMDQLYEQIREGMREWMDAPELDDDNLEEVVWPFIDSRLILISDAGTYFVMQQNGYYHSKEVGPARLESHIKHLGMDGLMPTTRLSDTGVVSHISPRDLGGKYGWGVDGIMLRPELPGAHITDWQSEKKELVINSYRRNPRLVPRYDAAVARWLFELCESEEDHRLLLDWLANAPAFDEGLICALSLVGPAGCGKKLIARGLAEILEYVTWATSSDLIGDWQYRLCESPFLVVNEGWPRPGKGKHPADRFRECITADDVDINQKYKVPARAYNPVRAILTANNLDVVRLLGSGKDLAPEDREALGVRLLHLKLSKKASVWLRAKGGMAFTGAPGNRWIAGDDGKKSDFVVAKHIMWLYEQRPKTLSKKRMLVEGNNPADLMRELRFSHGRSPLVAETLLNMVEKRHSKGWAVHEGELFVKAGAIKEYWTDHLKKGSSEQLTVTAAGKLLANFVVEKPMWEGSFILPGHTKENRVRWHQIDVPALLEEVQDKGFSCGTKALQALCDEQKARRAGTYTEPPKQKIQQSSKFGGRLGVN